MRILVAMSGGVDSTVTAYLLKKQGNDVVGVHFSFVDTKQQTQFDELEEIARSLDIKIIYKDFREEFREKIITSFVRDYENGITPNPCTLCNGTMKFEKLLQVMEEEKCDMVATGHYANVTKVGTSQSVGASYASPKETINSPDTRYCIRKSKNHQKDQSYMLYRLNQYQLSHVMFPLSDMNKEDVRKIATDLGLKVAEKKDSQDVCFIAGTNYQEFIKRFEFGDDYKEKIAIGKLKQDDIESIKSFSKGEFVGMNGEVLGYHNGIINYTIGQRKGMNIAFGERKFVVKIDGENNQVVLGDNDDLMSTEFQIYDIVFSCISKEELLSNIKEQNGSEQQEPPSFIAKLRYRHDGTRCNIVRAKGQDDMVLTCHLLSPVRAITRGQSAVFYDDDDNIMFGGRIL